MTNLSSKAKLIALVSNDFLIKSDCIVVLEGDFFHRVDEAARLFKADYADRILISGGLDKPKEGPCPAGKMKDYLARVYRIPAEKIIIEIYSQNTREQAVNVMKIVREKMWQKIILVASPFHQVRAFLTLLRTMKETGLEILIFNAPVKNLPWFDIELPRSRYELLNDEFEKIEKYGKLGDVASFKEALEYQKWKERQVLGK